MLQGLYKEDNKFLPENDTAKKYLDSRENIRKQALIYSKFVLPNTEDLFFNISMIMDDYTDLVFDEWMENSEEFQRKLSKTKELCFMLKEVHNEISQSLGAEKTSIDEAGIHQEYKKSRDSLIDQANDAYEISKTAAFWEKLIGVFDIFDIVARKAADRRFVYVKIVLQLTLDYFTGYLETMNTFIGDCHTNARKMDCYSDSIAKERNREAQLKHFKKMKARAGEIKRLCDVFVNTASKRMRNNLANLPRHDDDEAFLNDWLETKKIEFGLTQTQINHTR